MASATVIAGLSGLVVVHAQASAQPPPALKLQGGTPKPCNAKKNTITNGCSVKAKGTHWPKSSVVNVSECNAKVISGDANACSTSVVRATVGRGGRFTVDLTLTLGTVGDGSCSASGSPPTCYVQAQVVQTGGSIETARSSFTGGTTGGSSGGGGSTGNTVNWDGFNWTIIQRHGEYTQGETECNVPGAVSFAENILTITTTHQNATCGDILNAPSVWPYTTGDVQWTSYNFTYGTVSYQAKFPAKSTSLWPAVWFLGSGCQATNPLTGETDYGTCPQIEKPGSGYEEIDATECYQNEWCQLALAQTPDQSQPFPVCQYSVPDTNWHSYTLTWTPTEISMTMDGQPTGCSFSSSQGWVIPNKPMFMIIQTQTGGSGLTPVNSKLPAVLQVQDVTVTPG